MTGCVLSGVACAPPVDERAHEPDRERGLLCCAPSLLRLASALNVIPERVDELAGLGFVVRSASTDPVANVFPAGPVPGQRGGARVHAAPASSPPLSLDVVDLTSGVNHEARRLLARGVLGLDDDQVGHLSAATILHGWVRDWASIRREGEPMPTVRELSRWLSDRLDWAAGSHPALDEFATEVLELRAVLNALTGRSEPRPETLSAPCPECFMLTLHRDHDLQRVVCGAGCPTLMTEDEYARHVLGSIRPEDPSMRKIPTLFLRDPDDMKRVTDEVHPDCRWVLDGEGTPTRKYDGTCVMFDGAWWARREVKPGKAAPPLFVPVQTDEATGKTQGWEPIAQSAFAKYHAEALAGPHGLLDFFYPVREPVPGATYELCGPKVNGNPEKLDRHVLVRHGYRAAVDDDELRGLKLDHDSLRDWLLAHPAWEGIVWHHPDGRMAKLKRRDFPA